MRSLSITLHTDTTRRAKPRECEDQKEKASSFVRRLLFGVIDFDIIDMRLPQV